MITVTGGAMGRMRVLRMPWDASPAFDKWLKALICFKTDKIKSVVNIFRIIYVGIQKNHTFAFPKTVKIRKNHVGVFFIFSGDRIHLVRDESEKSGIESDLLRDRIEKPKIENYFSRDGNDFSGDRIKKSENRIECARDKVDHIRDRKKFAGVFFVFLHGRK